MSALSPTSTHSSKPANLTAMEEGKITCQSIYATCNAPTILHKITAEFVGTYILIFAGCGSILINVLHNITIVGVGLAWGMVVMVMICTVGHISGSHFNPAITFALAVTRKFPWKQVPTYVGSQLLGSTLACVTLYVLMHKQVSLANAVPGYSDPTTAVEAFVWEFIISFILMFVVCGLATDHRAAGELTGVAVGGSIIFNAIVAGHITGACMNPARSIGTALVTGKYDALWLFILAPTLGMVAAALLYSLMRPPTPEETEEATKSP